MECTPCTSCDEVELSKFNNGCICADKSGDKTASSERPWKLIPPHLTGTKFMCVCCSDGAANAVWRCPAPPHPHLLPGLLVLARSPPEGVQLVKPTLHQSQVVADNQKAISLNNVLNNLKGNITSCNVFTPVFFFSPTKYKGN